MGGSLENVEVDLKRFLNTVIFSVLILSCLIGRTLAQKANMVTPRYAFTTELSTVFQHSENVSFDKNGTHESIIKCYKCGAYRHRDGDDFDTLYNECKDLDTSKAEIEECPSFIAGEFTNAQCGMTIQTVRSRVTSFSRGCYFLRSCSESKECYDSKKNYSGVCRNCCNEALCNKSDPMHSTWSMITVCLLLKFYFR